MRPSDAVALLAAIFYHNLDCAARAAPAGDYLVPFLVGDPGVGKTAIVAAARDVVAATVADFGLLSIMFATYDPADLGGMPDITGNLSKRLRPDYLPAAGRGAMLLDEITKAGDLNGIVAAQLAEERRVGEHALAPGWSIVLAGNHRSNRAGDRELPSHLRNRIITIAVEPDVKDWIQWAAGAGLPAPLLAFMRWRGPVLLSAFKADAASFPSPRSWYKVALLIGLGLPPAIETAAIAGLVGEGAAAEFSGFLRLHRSACDPQGCIDNPAGAPVPSDPSMLYALSSVLAQNADADNLAAVLTYARRMGGEFAALLITLALSADPKKSAEVARVAELKATPAYRDWALSNPSHKA